MCVYYESFCYGLHNFAITIPGDYFIANSFNYYVGFCVGGYDYIDI